MALPSLDASTPMELSSQPPPLLPTGTAPTPMDTSPSPAIINTIANPISAPMSSLPIVSNIQGTSTLQTTGTMPGVSAISGTTVALQGAGPIQTNSTLQTISTIQASNPVQSTSSSAVSTLSNAGTASVTKPSPATNSSNISSGLGLSSLKSGAGSSTLSSSTTSSSDIPQQLLSKARLQDLVREVDPTAQLDEEVEELLMQLADDFVETTVSSACLFAKHRKANTIDVKDVQLHLERNWNMWIPGFGTDELRPYKRASVTEAHKQRLALIRKALKKY